ncbi:MAG: hypothetical protein ACLQVY_26260 [Limisphaerales bacterium]
MIEKTEILRRQLQIALNSASAERSVLEKRHGQVWNASELAQEFAVPEFAAPFAVVRRKLDNQLGSVMFQHAPRFYFAFEAHK